MGEISLKEYYDMLERHDWYYEYSDDHRVWTAGQAASNKLRGLRVSSPQHKELYDQFSKYAFSGPSFGNEKAPKPERPEE